MDFLALTTTILKTVIFIVLYLMIGFGPGFIVGVILANWLFGKGRQLRMDKHVTSIQQAAEYNKQWHPDHERWQKS